MALIGIIPVVVRVAALQICVSILCEKEEQEKKSASNEILRSFRVVRSEVAENLLNL
jgi:hypothetical protein